MRKYLLIFCMCLLCLAKYTFCQNIPNGVTIPVTKTAVKTTATPAPSIFYQRVLIPQIPITDSAQVNLGAPIESVEASTQYFDGLGRQLETVVKQASPAKKDFVAPAFFDNLGNPSIQYLPYTAQSANYNDGKYKASPLSADSSFYKGLFPNEQVYYGTALYDASPINRVVKQMAPGNSWAGSNKGVSYEERANALSDSVRIWSINIINEDDVPSGAAMYQPGSLLVKDITDERGNETLSYTDELGRVVLTKTELSAAPSTGHTGWICTYYVYDEMGHLRFVISPKATTFLLANNWDLLNNSDVVDNLCYSYWYDSRGRVTEKHIPGKGKTYIAYDLYDRAVMTQDENLRTASQWSFVKYDAQNRPDTTGLITMNSLTATQVITNAAAATDYPSLAGTYTVLAVNYYDDYSWVTGSIPAGTLTTTNINSTNFITTYNASPYYAQQIIQSKRIHGMATGSRKLVLGTSNYLYTVNIYDERGKLIQTKQTNYTGGTDIATNQYDFSGKILVNHLQHQKLGINTVNHTLLTKYTYDHIGRLTVIVKNIDGIADKTTLQNSYNELGQLSSKTLGQLESQALTYNIRGWLNGINKNYVETANSTTNYFGEEIFYDYGFNITFLNGNIAGLKWKSTGDDIQRAYGFNYDKTNRLSTADFRQQNDGSTSWTNDKMDFSVSGLKYDVNGNITSMTQKGVSINTPSTIDSLKYTYFTNSNQLEKVKDLISAPQNLGDFTDTTLTTDDYTYDVNGNLTKDNNKHIHTSTGSNGISYNFLDKADNITVNGKGGIAYTYDAAGRLLQKTVTDNRTNIKTVITYIAGFVYQKTLPSSGNAATIPDSLQYVLHEEGRIRWSYTQSHPSGSFVYDYFIKDHLSNIRSVLTDEKDTVRYPVASLESATLNNEKIYYDSLDNGRINKSLVNGYPVDNYTNPNDYTQQLNGNGSRIGAGILLKVMAGDKITVRANSWFSSTATPGTPLNPLNDILSALIASVPGTQGTKFVQSQLNSTVLTPGVTQFLNSRDANNVNTKPKAYFNVVMLDEQLNPVITTDGKNSFFQQVGSSGTFTTHSITDREITKSGYVYIYVSNETPNINVYFDNLQVTHTKGALLQEEGYYPFGLEMKAVSSAAALKPQTRYKFNAGTELEDNFDVDYYETSFREYDAQIGRFTGIDALAEKSYTQTTYQFAVNNPALLNDPFGLKDTPQQDNSAFWDNLLSTLDSYEYGGSYTGDGGGGGGGSFNGGYSSTNEAIYDNLNGAVQYWNNEGWNAEYMLNSLSKQGYISTHYGFSSKGNWGIYVRPFFSQTVQHNDMGNAIETDMYYSTGFFEKLKNPFGDANANVLLNVGTNLNGSESRTPHYFEKTAQITAVGADAFSVTTSSIKFAAKDLAPALKGLSKSGTVVGAIASGIPAVIHLGESWSHGEIGDWHDWTSVGLAGLGVAAEYFGIGETYDLIIASGTAAYDIYDISR